MLRKSEIGSGSTRRKVARALGTILIAVAVGCGGSSSRGPQAAGNWSGTWQGSLLSGDLTLMLIQSGSSLSGSVVVSKSPCTPGGSVAGSLQGASFDGVATDGKGTMVKLLGTLAGNQMTGTFSIMQGRCDGQTGTWTVTRSG